MHHQFLWPTVLILSLAFSLPFPSACLARQPRAWWYQELFDESDLVVIAAATSVKVADINIDITLLDRKRKDILKRLKHNPSSLLEILKGDDSPYEGIITTFRVGVALKGTLDDQEIEIVHCRYKHGSKSGLDGAGFVCFGIEEGKEKKLDRLWEIDFSGEPSYLLFLKERKDGRYEMVSGQMDPVNAVREITYPRSHRRHSSDSVSDIHFPPPKTFAMSLPVKIAFIVMAVVLALTGASYWRLRRKLQDGPAQNQIDSNHEDARA